MNWFSYVILAIFAVIVLLNFYPLIRARRMRGHAVPALDALLTDAQRNKRRIFVYFWGPSCGMCRPMSPIIDKLANERDDVIKINIAESMEMAKHFGVMATPTLAIVENGKLKNLVLGAKSESQIRALMEQK